MEILDILERLRKKESIRSINKKTGIHRTIIREIRQTASENDWLNPNSELPSENELLNSRSFESDKKEHPLNQFKEEMKRWIDKKYSFVVIHELIKDKYPCSESTVRRFIHQNFPSKPKPTAVRNAIPGQIMEVDFGYVGLLYDPLEKRNRKAWLFSGRLNYSRIAWREIVFDQRQETFFQCHIRAFEFFGGVPEQVVPDNLKAAVIKASHEDPLVNRAYRSLARHYGFTINPCLPRTPEHKGGVENDIKYVKNNFLPLFKERSLQLGREVPSIEDANDSLEKWSCDTAHTRIIKDVGVSPDQLYTTEKSTLKQLPSASWDIESWSEVKVGRDWRIKVDKSRYSVPCDKIGEQVQVCSTFNLIRVFHQGKEITTHERANKVHSDIWKENHAPPSQVAYLSTTKEGVYQRACKVGPETALVVRCILDRPEVDGLRPAKNLLNLLKTYSEQRLENACKRANQFETQSYGSIKNILKKNLDQKESDLQIQEATIETSKQYRFARVLISFTGLTLSFTLKGDLLWMTLSF